MKIEHCKRCLPNHHDVLTPNWLWWNETKQTVYPGSRAENGATADYDKAFCGGRCNVCEQDFILLCPDCLKLNGIVW